MKPNARNAGSTLILAILLLLPFTGQCFYNAATGRWLSRDPVAEPKPEAVPVSPSKPPHLDDGNPYGFVRNNPISRCDFLGLSDEDVTRIISQFMATMKEMCDKKRRCDCFGVGPLKDVRAAFGKPYGCAAQADWMEGDIISLTPKFDDKWSEEHRRYLEMWPVFYHQDVILKPLDAKSGDIESIALDTFAGCYTITRRTLVQTPDPMQSFWLYRYENKCYTCGDFKK